MTRLARSDSNQGAIVATLRRAGVSVVSLAHVGQGFPDLACGRNGVTYLLEVKRRGAKLNPREAVWHAIWRGHVAVVRTEGEALTACGIGG